MTPERHRDFAERITRSMEKLTTTDYEAVRRNGQAMQAPS